MPIAGAVTSTVTTHVSPPAIEPPENATDPAPGDGENVAAPQPAPTVVFGAGATTMAPGATGNVSEKATPEMASSGFGLVMVKVSVDTPFARMGDGANALAIAGGSTAVSVSVAGVSSPVPPSVVVTMPLTFVCTPPAVAVTSTDTVQALLAGIVPPVSVTVVAPAAGTQVPPQVVLAFGVAAT